MLLLPVNSAVQLQTLLSEKKRIKMVQTAVRLLSTVTMLSMMSQHANSGRRGTVISLCIHVCNVELCLNNFNSTVGYLLLNSCNGVKLCLSGCLFDQRVSHVDRRCHYFRQQREKVLIWCFFTFSRLKFPHSITQLELKLSSLELKQRGSDCNLEFKGYTGQLR